MIEKYLAWIEEEVRKKNTAIKSKALYDPIRYIMKLGGKRVRPLLVLLSYSLYKTDVRKIISLAIAIEALHNFTLIHDDIMDKAPLRRGRRTVHEKWDVNTAILSGDVMLVKVYGLLTQIPPHLLKEGLTKFNTCVADICEGQYQDMAFESMKQVSRRAYLNMARKKTAVLLGFSLEFGAFLAEAHKTEQKILREVGIDIGIGFQLMDDLLDTYAQKGSFGKQIGGDIICNKKNFLLVTALENAKGKDKSDLYRWMNQKQLDNRKKIQSVIALYDKLGVPAYTKKRRDFFLRRGLAKLDRIKTADSKKDVLKKFITNLANRNV